MILRRLKQQFFCAGSEQEAGVECKKTLSQVVDENAEANRVLMHVFGRTPNKRGSNALDELAIQLARGNRWTGR